MSTWVHKGSESKLVEPIYLQEELRNGWSVEKKKRRTRKKPDIANPLADVSEEDAAEPTE